MRYLKIFESFSDGQTVKDLWGIDPEDNIRLVLSCLEETGLDVIAGYEIFYAVLETVEVKRAPGLPSFGSRHFRACFVQDRERLRVDDVYEQPFYALPGLRPQSSEEYIERLKASGPSESFIPMIEVRVTGLDEDHDEQVAEFSRMYGERFRQYFGGAYYIDETDWTTSDGYSMTLHMVI
jgi:hypothetical protein